jgi:hypothetical protein
LAPGQVQLLRQLGIFIYASMQAATCVDAYLRPAPSREYTGNWRNHCDAPLIPDFSLRRPGHVFDGPDSNLCSNP